MSYHQQWQDYRKRGLLFWFFFLSFIPAVALTGLLLKSIGAAVVAAILWAVAITVTGIYKTRWKCPRCHQPFQTWEPGNPAAIGISCMHCGLPRRAEPDEDRK